MKGTAHQGLYDLRVLDRTPEFYTRPIILRCDNNRDFKWSLNSHLMLF